MKIHYGHQRLHPVCRPSGYRSWLTFGTAPCRVLCVSNSLRVLYTILASETSEKWQIE